MSIDEITRAAPGFCTQSNQLIWTGYSKAFSHMLEIAIEDYGFSRRMCSSPADCHAEKPQFRRALSFQSAVRSITSNVSRFIWEEIALKLFSRLKDVSLLFAGVDLHPIACFRN